MSKGSTRRQGTGYEDNITRICPQPTKYCACGYLPAWCKCEGEVAKDEKDEKEKAE